MKAVSYRGYTIFYDEKDVTAYKDDKMVCHVETKHVMTKDEIISWIDALILIRGEEREVKMHE